MCQEGENNKQQEARTFWHFFSTNSKLTSLIVVLQWQQSLHKLVFTYPSIHPSIHILLSTFLTVQWQGIDTRSGQLLLKTSFISEGKATFPIKSTPLNLITQCNLSSETKHAAPLLVFIWGCFHVHFISIFICHPCIRYGSSAQGSATRLHYGWTWPSDATWMYDLDRVSNLGSFFYTF